ncbi:hypothetical protein PHET_09474 [Paragonimus heterotremus]|uniref:Uncharacterized protein n=1 Tax=Paragonimus heterotremus TaxID=100268 RepID=A0A8J4SGU4_9TREM|nr:hypothetical protein PHET_09474 [Paragonimus heterotremus]
MLTNHPSQRLTYLEEPLVYDWSDTLSANTEVNSIASEAASHRRKLEKLRRDFLSSTAFTKTEDSLLASSPTASSQQAVSTQPILLDTLLAPDIWSANCHSETLSNSNIPTCDLQSHAFQFETVDDQVMHPPHLSNVIIDCGHSPTISESLTIDPSGSEDHASLFVRRPISVVFSDHDLCLSPAGHYSLQVNELVVASSSPINSPVLNTQGLPFDACSSPEPLVTLYSDGAPHFICTGPAHPCPCSRTEYANGASARTALFGVTITELDRSPEHKVQPTVTLFTEQRAHCTNHVQTNKVCANSFANWSCQNYASATADENRSSPTLVSNFNLPPYVRLTYRKESAQLTGTTPVQTKMNDQDPSYRSKSDYLPNRTGIRHSVSRPTEQQYSSTAHQSSNRMFSSAQPGEQIVMQYVTPSVVPECIYAPKGVNRCRTDLNKSPDLLRKKQSMDANLSKMDRTLKDFTSHLSQIDSTLGRMKGFGSLSQYLDSFSNFVGEGCESGQSSSRSPPSTRQASTQESVSSSHSGQSFDCNPIAFDTSPKPDDPKHPFALSSSLGASLTTLSSSVWSSLSPSTKMNGYRNTPVTTCATRRFDFSSSGQPTVAYPGKHASSSQANPAAFRDVSDNSCSSGSASVVSVEEPIFRRSSKPRPPADRLPANASKSDHRSTNVIHSQSGGLFKTGKHMRQSSSVSRPDDDRSEEHEQVGGSSSKVYPGSPEAQRLHVPRVAATTGQSAQHRQLHISSPELHVPTRRDHSDHHLEHRALPSTPDLSVNQSAISLSDNKRTNFYPSSHSSGSERSHYDRSSSSDTQESVNALTEHLSHLLRTGKERKARTVIGDLLCSSTSRSKLRGVIASLSSECHLTGSTVSSCLQCAILTGHFVNILNISINPSCLCDSFVDLASKGLSSSILFWYATFVPFVVLIFLWTLFNLYIILHILGSYVMYSGLH